MDAEILKKISEKVYLSLGRFYEKSIYINALKNEFENNDIKVEMNKSFSVLYDNKKVGEFFFDFYIDNIPIEVVIGNIDKKNIELFKNRIYNNNIEYGFIIVLLTSQDNNQYVTVLKIKP